MRIAILIPGLPGKWRECYKSMLNAFVDPLVSRADVYLSCWTEETPEPPWGIAPKLEDQLRAAYNPKGFHKERFQPFRAQIYQRLNLLYYLMPTENGRNLVEQMFWQHYQISNCFRLIERPEDYDLIFKVRFDMAIVDPIDWRALSDLLNVDAFDGAIFHSNTAIWGWKPYEMSDKFAIGRPEEMAIYCSLYHQFERVAEVTSIFPEPNMECWLAYYLKDCHRLTLKEFHIGFELHRHGPKANRGKKNEVDRDTAG